MNKKSNKLRLCGIDEAGRGPLAGSLVVAGVIINKSIKNLTDSKKTSQKRREMLFPIIKSSAYCHIISFSAKMIDDMGISKCMHQALLEIKFYFGECDYIFDGNTTFGVDGITAIVKADSKIPEVSAASIIAKVTHDNEMIHLASKYPQYGFQNNKGYSTEAHRSALLKYGRTDVHRHTFYVKELDDSCYNKQSNTGNQ